VHARLRPSDVARVAISGLRTRPGRATLSAAGIAIGIAAMLAVLGMTFSSRADLDRTLDRLGTNLLTVSPGTSVTGQQAKLPREAPAMIGRIGPVRMASATARLSAAVYRHDRMPSGQTSSVMVLATRLDLLDAVGGSVGTGAWLSDATAGYPAVVLGSVAAQRLGVDGTDARVWLGGTWFGVAGVLRPVPLATELDSAALVGWSAATTWLRFDGHPTTVYVRAAEHRVEAVRSVLAATANPAHPEQVRVSRPSDALAARRAADRTFSALLLGLGAVALLVGGIGVTNTMLVAVLERRTEIGLRRCLGATRGQIRTQFLIESLLLSAIGGAAGVLCAVAATGGYASAQGWPLLLPWWASSGGFVATLFVGAVAGAYPAARASGLPPTEALATA
jgi:putative ABC transport system permease protein